MTNLAEYFLLIILPMILGIWAQMKVSRAFKKWQEIGTASGLSGAEVARTVLNAAQIQDVEVVEINDMLGDHYDPSNKRLCLSTPVYHNPSVAAAGIAAHEAGHAIQHAKAYAPLHARMAMVPLTMLASQALPFIMIGGFLFGMFGLVKIGFWCYLVLAIFQLITLPVEFDASRRAKLVLEGLGIVRDEEEAKGVNDVLNSAALTYVAAFVAALGNLIYLWMMMQGRRDE